MTAHSSPRTFYLLGPTAVGKSLVAVAMAEQWNAEIVSADAFQLYAELPILTAWPESALRARVPHHLIGTVAPREHCDVARFRAAAVEAIRDIHARGKNAIVAGGTGLYIRALTRGLAKIPSADPTLRANLERQSLGELQQRLRAVDPQAAQTIDMENPRRIVRALEVGTLTGRSFTAFREEWNAPPSPELRGAILMHARDALCARIDERTRRMFATGVVEEVERVGELGATAAQAIGYRQIRAYLAGNGTREECIRNIQQATRRYAKRQVTWLRRESHFPQIMMSAPEGQNDIARVVDECFRALQMS